MLSVEELEILPVGTEMVILPSIAWKTETLDSFLQERKRAIFKRTNAETLYRPLWGNVKETGRNTCGLSRGRRHPSRTERVLHNKRKAKYLYGFAASRCGGACTISLGFPWPDLLGFPAPPVPM